MKAESSTTVIKGNIDEVFSVAKNVEKYSEFIPQFKETRIIREDGNKIIMERKVKIGWLHSNWQSEMVTEENKCIRFVHLSGLLKGMKTKWRFKDTGKEVKIKVLHNFEIRIPIVGRIMEFVIWNIFIKKTAKAMLKKMKERVEGKI